MDEAVKASRKDIAHILLNHYEELSNLACSFHTSIPQAINAWVEIEEVQKENERLKAEIEALVLHCSDLAREKNDYKHAYEKLKKEKGK